MAFENAIKRQSDGSVEGSIKKKKKKSKRAEAVGTDELDESVETGVVVSEEVEAETGLADGTVKKKKKSKRSETAAETAEEPDDVAWEKTANVAADDRVAKPKKARELPTVAIAVPGSILDNAQSPEFRTYLAGQIARAACIYKIDEVRIGCSHSTRRTWGAKLRVWPEWYLGT